MGSCVAFVVAAILVLPTGFARAQSIGIHADPAGTSCQITAPQYAATTFHVNVVGSGVFTPAGIQGFAYRLVVPFELGGRCSDHRHFQFSQL